MSTRCQIGFYENDTDKLSKYKTLIYKHTDGYEEGILPLLIPLVRDFNKYRNSSDWEYKAAQVLYAFMDATTKYDKKNEYYNDISKYMGYGISRSIQCDIEYYYAVYPSFIKVYEAKAYLSKLNMSKWSLIQTIEV